MKIEVLRQVQAANDATADDTRRLLAERGICMLNVMGGAGCGKTALLERLLPQLTPDLRCAVLEGDLATAQDAERIARLGVPVVQLQTDGCCHLDAWLVFAGLNKLPLDQLDLVIVENVGNLVCPAEFDIGEHARLAVLSLMEGDDKPSKYPLLFSRATAVALSKCDLSAYAEFDLPRASRDITQVNADVPIFRTGRDQPGDGSLLTWIRETHAAHANGTARIG
ncbi:MAG TPA: hydrogenase nickel incorporation protein HypB [Phycisphaerae bacterium]|nr:hydrogenase nickel incorporation protein HypB [Phycisphaerae bacterium]